MAVVVRPAREPELPGSGWEVHPWGLYSALAGLIASGIFVFLVYSQIASPVGAVLDPDGYGALGWGLWKLHTFSYFPSSLPSANRGPLYPFIVAGLLYISRGWWPYSVQLFQCACFGLTCLLVFEIGRRLWNRKIGAIAGLSCAFHPFLIWYTSRIWIESVTILLFTAIVATLLYFQEKPTVPRAALLGLIIGAACLSKATFLPFIVAVPALLWIVKPKVARPKAILCTAIVPLLVILPWSFRNWTLTGAFVPVHGHMGFNVFIGDSLAEHFSESPFGFTPLWDIATSEAAALVGPELSRNFDGWQAEMAVNSILYQDSLQNYVSNPLFLVRKILLNAVTFWTWSETELKTLVVSALQVPLASVFACSLVPMVRKGQFRTLLGLPVALVLLFYISHLPVLAIAMYSAVLVPVMLAYSAATLFED